MEQLARDGRVAGSIPASACGQGIAASPIRLNAQRSDWTGSPSAAHCVSGAAGRHGDGLLLWKLLHPCRSAGGQRLTAGGGGRGRALWMTRRVVC